MSGTDRAIRYAAVLTVLIVAAIAATVSYQHAYELVSTHGESGRTARALPLTVDGLILTCSLVVVDSARRGERAPFAAWALLALGIAATLGANIAHGLAHGPVGAMVSGWPALVAVGSFELVSRLIRGNRSDEERKPAEFIQPEHAPEVQRVPAVSAVPDEVQVRALQVFSDDIAAGRLPGIRAVKQELRVGQPKAKEVRAYLAVLAGK